MGRMTSWDTAGSEDEFALIGQAAEELGLTAPPVIRVGDGVSALVWNDDLGRAVHHGVDLILGEDAIEQILVRDVALVEGAIADELAASRRQVVENHHLVAGLLAGRTDISRSARDEDPHL